MDVGVILEHSCSFLASGHKQPLFNSPPPARKASNHVVIIIVVVFSVVIVLVAVVIVVVLVFFIQYCRQNTPPLCQECIRPQGWLLCQ